MTIDINAFRSIANQGPDKFVYAQGETLKTTKNQAHHDAHTYTAATNAFLKACVDHYGSRMGEAIVKFLQSDIEGGKPLTARKIKALVEFADESMGSATHINVGGKAVELEKVGTDSMSRVGFRTETKFDKAQAGQQSSAAATLAAFKFGADGKVDLDAMLRHLNTFRAYIDREIAAHPHPKPSAVKIFEEGLFTAVDAMDNNELSAVYQGLISKQTDGFKKELARIINHPDVKESVRPLAEKAFADVSRIEAMVTSEISRRMILDRTPDDQKADVPSLMQYYVGPDANPANHYAGDRDMSTVNLAIMAGKAAKGSNDAKTANAKTDAVLKSHAMGAVDSKKIGDMLRSQELTINMKFAALMGYSRTGEKRPSLFKTPDAHLLNTFESRELRGRDKLETEVLRHRNQVEQCFFPEYADKPLQGRDRPVYGALNTIKLTSGAADTTVGIYGKVVVVLRPHVKQNCTYTLDDSFWATRLSLPVSKRAEMEQTLVSAFSAKLKDQDAALAELRDPASDIHKDVDIFYAQFGPVTENIGAQRLEELIHHVRKFLNKHLKEGEAKVQDGDLYAHFGKHHLHRQATQGSVAGYDNIENLLAREDGFTALSMGLATLRSQENPKSPCSFSGHAYIEAQFHGPVVLDRDVEEIRIDMVEMRTHFEEAFDDLPEEQQDGLDKADWVRRRCKETVREIKADTRNAPFKVTFYDSETTVEAEAQRLVSATESMEQEARGLLKDDFVALGRSLMGERFGEIKARVLRGFASSQNDKQRILSIVGNNLETIPDWIMDAAKSLMEKEIATFGTDTFVTSEEKVEVSLAGKIHSLLVNLNDAMAYMDAKGPADPGARDALLKEITRMEVGMKNPKEIEQYIDIHLAGEKALADLGAYVKESFEKDIEGGSELFKLAFNGLPPVSGVAADTLRRRIQDELKTLKTQIARHTLPLLENKTPQLLERLRKNTVQAYMERRARITVAQVHMTFPGEAERNAFLGWATSAGKLKTNAEFEGVYEGSTQLADTLEAKIASDAPLTAQDLVDAFKSFVGTAVDAMEQDAKDRDEYGPDDRANFVGRITSVALSRLALRVGREGLAKLAAALDTAEARWLHTAILAGDPTEPGNFAGRRGGTFALAVSFLGTPHRRLTEKHGIKTHPTDPPGGVTYGVVPPDVRVLARQINPVQARELEELYPYDPADSGARRLVNIPAPANPAAMPQDKAGRKQFLLRMLPTYHNHEKTFDYGTNWHGRTHATRAFVFSVTMANILKEKGVAVDMNAVTLATAGHDTGRRRNGRDTEGSEKRSAANTINAVNEAWPDAAGPQWSAQIEINITSNAAQQDTIEGYLFKSADSLDFPRVGKLDPKRFPFLKENIVTADGFILPSDNGIRRQLMKEATLLTELTAPSYPLEAEHDQLQNEIADLPDGPERQAKTARQTELEAQMYQREKEQTDTLTDQQIVDLVENAIRTRPQDFPLLTKYYLNAE